MSKRLSSGWSLTSIDNPKPVNWQETKLFNDWKNAVKDGANNDYIIAVSASSRTGVSGTGKTTVGVSLCEAFDQTDAGWDAEKRGTMDPSKFAYDILVNSPEGSAMLLEEAQGTPSSTGLNKRRSMKTEVMDTINAMLANRDSRYTVVIVVQRLSMLDVSLVPLLDAWLMITKEPHDPGGPELTCHEVHGEDYQLKTEDLKTPAKEDLEWPRVDNLDNYHEMERKKQLAKTKNESDDGGEGRMTKDDLPVHLRDEIIYENYVKSDRTQAEFAEDWDLSRVRINQIISEQESSE